MNLRFTWNSGKAERNQRRHQVSFEEVVEAFFDPNAVDDYDADHSVTEHRYHLIGLSSRRLFCCVFRTSRGNRPDHFGS